MSAATTAMRDQVAAVLRDARPERLSTEAIAARMRCLPLEVHSHLRALERRTQARRSHSADYLSVYWRWIGPVDVAIDALEAVLDAA
jgi:hypothetical protein